MVTLNGVSTLENGWAMTTSPEGSMTISAWSLSQVSALRAVSGEMGSVAAMAVASGAVPHSAMVVKIRCRTSQVAAGGVSMGRW